MRADTNSAGHETCGYESSAEARHGPGSCSKDICAKNNGTQGSGAEACQGSVCCAKGRRKEDGEVSDFRQTRRIGGNQSGAP